MGQMLCRHLDEIAVERREQVPVLRLVGGAPFAAACGALEARLEFRRIQAQVRKTVVIVTHDMAEAFALADRVGVLDDGVIAQLDAPRELARSTDSRVRPLLEPLLEARAYMS